jgi:hypothetical protein
MRASHPLGNSGRQRGTGAVTIVATWRLVMAYGSRRRDMALRPKRMRSKA